MRTITAKSTVTNPVKPTKLGVIMKAQVRSRSQDVQPSVFPKTSNINAPSGGAKKSESIASNTTLPPRWVSTCAPRDSPFRFVTKDPKCSTSFSGVRPKHSTPVAKKRPTQEKSVLDKRNEIQIPPREKYQSSRTSKHTDKPRLHTNSIVNLSLKLKQKDLEINSLKQKLWFGDSVKKRTRSSSKPNVLEVLGSFDGKESFQSPSKSAKSVTHESDMNDLHSDIAQKDIEILMLKQQNWKLQERLEKKMLEINDIQNQLQRKDLEMLDILNVKNDEIIQLKQNNLNLKTDIEKLNVREVKKLSEDNCIDDDAKDNTNYLEKETAEFLERVSAVCKDKSMKVKAMSKDKDVKIQVKVTVRKEKTDKVSHQLSFSDTFDSSYVFARTPCQELCIKEVCEDDDDLELLRKHDDRYNLVNSDAHVDGSNEFVKSVERVLHGEDN